MESILNVSICENILLFKAYCATRYNINFEFSGPSTQQRDRKVERKFQSFCGRIRAMLDNAGLKIAKDLVFGLTMQEQQFSSLT
jgi:hypothetical protein